MNKTLICSAVALGVLGFAVTPALAACGHQILQSVQVDQESTTVQSDQTVKPLIQTAQQPTTAK
jgi:hypothetical protein